MKFAMLFTALAALTPGMAKAVFLDCLSNDGFENTAGNAPANWKAHLRVANCARKTVIPAASPALAAMSWDSSLAATAQTYADRCIWRHSGTAGLGENLFSGANSSGFPANPELAAVNSWASESTKYNYSSNACSGVCGHYTQLVWRNSVRVGCGVRNCSSGSPFSGFPNWTIVVCNYSPPGNFSGTRPY